MKASLKISQIESKISDLQSKKQRLLEERQKEVAALITTLDLASLEDKILIGELQFLKHKIITHDPMMEDWHAAGERFLKHRKRSKKLNSSKKHTVTFTTHQSSQKSPQSRKKKNENAKPI